MCPVRELIKKEVDERIQWVLTRENMLKAEKIRLEVRRVPEESAEKVQQQNAPITTLAKGLLFVLSFLFIGYPVCRPEGAESS